MLFFTMPRLFRLQLSKMNINFSERKWELQKSRRFQDIFEWEKYLELVYPAWWASIYRDKWPVRIIYYNADNSFTEFHFHVYRYTSMESIMKKLHSLQMGQFHAICSCFGHDIAMIIYNYMSDIFDPKNNFFYYHSRPLNVDDPNGCKITKVLLKSTTTLNELVCTTRNHVVKSRYTNLRMRSIPTKKPSQFL